MAGDRDLTPEVGAQTDISRLGRGAPKPPHEQTADEDIDFKDWEKIANDPDFRSLLKKKRRFIVAATIFFILYYFALPILVGYAPGFMSRPVLGPVNLAYLFALSQFFVAWALAAIYIRVAAKFDHETALLLRKFRGPK